MLFDYLLHWMLNNLFELILING